MKFRVVPSSVLLGAIGVVAGVCVAPARAFAEDLVVSSNVRGASIFLNGMDTGLKTPATIVGLSPGVYQVTVKDDCNRGEAGITVASGTTTRASVLVSPAPGTVVIDVDPRNALLTVDDEETTIVAGAPASLGCGAHTIRASLDGYIPAAVPVDVEAGQEVRVPVRLQELGMATIELSVSPRNATILFDGKDVGSDAVTLPSVYEGNHTVGAELDGYQTATRTVSVDGGADLLYHINLRREGAGRKSEVTGGAAGGTSTTTSTVVSDSPPSKKDADAAKAKADADAKAKADAAAKAKADAEREAEEEAAAEEARRKADEESEAEREAEETAAKKKAADDAAAKKAADDAAAKKLADDAARKKAADDAAKKKAADDAAKKKAADDAAKKKAADDAAKKKADDEAAAEAEAAREAEEEAAREAEEAAEKKAADDAAKKAAADAAKKKASDDAAKKAAADAAKKKAADDAAAEEEARREAEAAAAQEEAERDAAEEKAAADAAKKKSATEAKRKAEEEAREEARQKAAEQEERDREAAAREAEKRSKTHKHANNPTLDIAGAGVMAAGAATGVGALFAYYPATNAYEAWKSKADAANAGDDPRLDKAAEQYKNAEFEPKVTLYYGLLVATPVFLGAGLTMILIDADAPIFVPVQGGGVVTWSARF